MGRRQDTVSPLHVLRDVAKATGAILAEIQAQSVLLADKAAGAPVVDDFCLWNLERAAEDVMKQAAAMKRLAATARRRNAKNAGVR